MLFFLYASWVEVNPAPTVESGKESGSGEANIREWPPKPVEEYVIFYT